MKLRRLEIENFRGITSLDLKLGDTTVLIGENNSGKTAVLDALRFALRNIRTRRGCAFEAYDFHLPNASAEPSSSPAISIRLTFREDNAGDWGDQQNARLNRVKILQIDKDGCATVILKVSAHFDAPTQEFVQNWEFHNLDGVPLTGLSDTAITLLQAEVSYYYLAALRDATKQFDAKGPFWRPFLKESQLTPAKRKEIEDKLSEVNDLIISSHTSFSQVVERLKEVQDVVSMTGGDDLVSICAVPSRLFDMLSKAEVNLNTDTGAKIPVGRHGEGTQSLAVLTLFNAYLQAWNKGDSIVALEEPEAHLHPSAVRALWQLIERIPGQKIISTHSGDLLSEVPFDAVVRLYRQSSNTITKRLQDITLEPKRQRQFNYHIRHARGELLFAKCWVLGEGETEVTILPELARFLDKNFESLGIRCIAYRQSDISLFINVAEHMGIHWVAITDNDNQGKTDKKKAEEALNGSVASDVIIAMPEEDIEQHLCAAGFSHIYESYLTKQTHSQITVKPTDPDYYKQLTKAVKDHKIAAVNQIIDEIKSGATIPPLLESVIDKAIKRATI